MGHAHETERKWKTKKGAKSTKKEKRVRKQTTFGSVVVYWCENVERQRSYL